MHYLPYGDRTKFESDFKMYGHDSGDLIIPIIQSTTTLSDYPSCFFIFVPVDHMRINLLSEHLVKVLFYITRRIQCIVGSLYAVLVSFPDHQTLPCSARKRVWYKVGILGCAENDNHELIKRTRFCLLRPLKVQLAQHGWNVELCTHFTQRKRSVSNPGYVVSNIYGVCVCVCVCVCVTSHFRSVCSS